MSGAEVVAAISLASSIAQLVDCTSRAIRLARDINKGSAFADVIPQLELFQADVQKVRNTISETPGSTNDAPVVETVSRVLNGCIRQVTTMLDILASMKPTSSVSHLRRPWTGLRNLGKEARVKEIMAILDQYKATLSLHLLTDFVQGSNKASRPKLRLIPRRRVAHFVGRRELIRHLKDFLTKHLRQPFTVFQDSIGLHTQPTAVLMGLGGQGKTQITLEVCNRCSEDFEIMIWINASSKHAALLDFKSAANRLSNGTFLTYGKGDVEVVSYVHDRLSEAAGCWLMIFDNYDDPFRFPDICEFFPAQTQASAGRGSMIITSRHNASARFGTRFEVPGLTTEEGLELLIRGTKFGDLTGADIADARVLVGKLGNLALAIDQAAAYISSRKMPWKLSLQLFESRKEAILSYTPAIWEYASQADDRNVLSASTTWELSLDQITAEHVGKEAIAAFLTLVAFLGSVNVSERLLSSYAQFADRFWIKCMDIFLADGSWDSERFQDVIVTLADLSLIQTVEYDGLYMLISLHPIIKEWLQLRSDLTTRMTMIRDSINLLALFIASNEAIDLNHITRGSLISHIDACQASVSRFLTNTESLIKYGCYLEGQQSVLSRFYASHDREESAQSLLFQALRLQTEKLGSNHIGTIASTNELAGLYVRQRRYAEAESILLQVIEGKRQHFIENPSDIKVSNSVNELGIVYNFLGRHDEAEKLFRENLQTFQHCQDAGPHHFMITYNNLAEIELHRGNLSQALNLLSLAEGASETMEIDPNFLSKRLENRNELLCQVKINQARVHYLMGSHEPALEEYQSILMDFNQLFGSKHSKTLALEDEFQKAAIGVMQLEKGVCEEANWGATMENLSNIVIESSSNVQPDTGESSKKNLHSKTVPDRNYAFPMPQRSHSFHPSNTTAPSFTSNQNFGYPIQQSMHSFHSAQPPNMTAPNFPSDWTFGLEMIQPMHPFHQTQPSQMATDDAQSIRRRQQELPITRQMQGDSSTPVRRNSGVNSGARQAQQQHVFTTSNAVEPQRPSLALADYNAQLQLLEMQNRNAVFLARGHQTGSRPDTGDK